MAGTTSTVDLVTSSTSGYTFANQIVENLQLNRGEVLVSNRDRFPYEGNQRHRGSSRPDDIPPFVGNPIPYAHAPNGLLYHGTPLPYLFHAEIGGLTAGAELILAHGGKGRMIAVGIAGGRVQGARTFCDEVCTPVLHRLGFTMHNEQYAALPDVGYLGLDHRAFQIHSQQSEDNMRRRVTAITRVELYPADED